MPFENWVNPVAQDPGQPQTTRWAINFLKLTDGIGTGGNANKTDKGYALPSGMKLGPDGLGNPGVTGRLNLFKIPRAYYGQRGFGGMYRYYWRSNDPVAGQGGTVIESNAMPNIPNPVNGGTQRTVRGYTWQYQDFEWWPPKGSVSYNIEYIQPDANGFYTIEDALIHHDDIADWEFGYEVPQDFIETISRFDGIRPMRQVGANLTANDPPFADYRFITPQHQTWTRGQNPDGIGTTYEPKSFPIEVLVEICERANIGLWYNIAPDASLSAVQTVYEYLAANWPTSLPLRTENANELWNSVFAGFTYYLEQGRLIWPEGSGVGDNAAIANYSAWKINQIAPVIETALAGRGIDHKWVLGGSATGNTSFDTQQMEALEAKNLVGWDPTYAPENIMDYVSYGMYFGGAEGGFDVWLKETFPREYDQAVFYLDMIESGVGKTVVGPGKNTLPNGIMGSTVGAPSTGWLATHYVRIGDVLERYNNQLPSGDRQYKQNYIWADQGTPDTTDVIRINRDTDPVRVQINLSLVPAHTGPDWWTIVEYAPGENPPTLYEMSRSTQFSAVGTTTEGVNGQLTRAFQIRFLRHVPFATTWGVQIFGYEGGWGNAGEPGNASEDLPGAFKFLMHYGPLAKRMQQVYLTFIAEAEAAGVAGAAWFEMTSPSNWEGPYQTQDTRGLQRIMRSEWPIELANPKLRGGLNLPVL